MLDIAIVDGVRTPFAKAFGILSRVTAQEMGRHVTEAVLQRAGIGADQVDQVVYGNVAMPPEAANVARVIALTAGIPRDRPAHTVQRNCASGFESITTAADLVRLDEARTVVAGGVESMTRIPLLYSEEAKSRFLELARARNVAGRIKAILKFRPRHFKPIPSVRLGLTDPVSGLLMGETAEVLVEDFDIQREEQDAFALESHRRAVRAQEAGVFREEIVPLPTGHNGELLQEDIGPRPNQSLESLAKLRPYFKKNGGTVTVGNSCMLTDGGAAVIVTSGDAARAGGRPPLGYLRAFAYAGCDPRRMGLGPIFAVSKLLSQTAMVLKDIDLIEMNEAFAAQVLANLRAFASDQFAREQLGRTKALGEIDRARLNVNGGAIALGHPVGATGTRLVITLLKELKRRNLRWGIACLCVGGGQGGALLLENSA